MSDQETILKAAAEAAMQQQQQPPQPQIIPPSPVPMTIQMMTTQGQDGKLVVLVFNHSLGQSVYHFTPEGAELVAEGLNNTARLARTGLEIAR